AVGEVMHTESIVLFEPDEDASDAAQAFERYDLISAPVVDRERRVIGRLTVADMVDHIREASEQELLNQAGLLEGEDIFAPILNSVRNRWPWLAINMVTAIIASRVIGAFEDSIERLVALAALMPIVAGIGGNSGNQTITMIVRAIAMGQVEPSALKRLLRKEIGVSLVNGVFWGGFLGLMAWWLYGKWDLGLVMTVAMILNLLLAASAGVLIPMIRARMNKDPALGAAVMITALTDSGGFLIFLGLATIFLF
ncbi:MAG: magnesium transporter, partial [Thiotrichales bacterium]